MTLKEMANGPRRSAIMQMQAVLATSLAIGINEGLYSPFTKYEKELVPTGEKPFEEGSEGHLSLIEKRRLKEERRSKRNKSSMKSLGET